MTEISVSDIQIFPVRPKNGLIAFVSCVVNGAIYIGNIALFTSFTNPSGFRLAYPNKRLPNGQIIDEIGRMEIKSSKFMDLLEKAFSSKTPVIASVSNEYADNYKAYGEIVMLTPTNREAVYLDLINKTTESYVEKKPEKEETFPAKKIRKPRKKTKKKKAKKKKKPRKKKEKPKPPMEEEKPKKPEKEEKGFFGGLKDWLGI